MKILKILIFISLVYWAKAEPQKCCSNNAPIQPGIGCMNNGTKTIKCKAYAVFPSSMNTVDINDDDSLILSEEVIISRERYCVGSYLPKEENNIIILICFPNTNQGGRSALFVACLLTVSIVCLSLTLLVYLILPRLRDLQGKCIMSTIFSLLIAFSITASGQSMYTVPFTLCYLIGSSMYFWFLCVFFWSNVVAFHIWRSTICSTYPENTKMTFWYYNAYGWGVPILILIIAKILYHIPGDHLKPSWAVSTCWFRNDHTLTIFFHVPILILLTSNIVMFILTAYALRKQTELLSNVKLRSRKYKFLLYLKLFLIMGVSWIFEPLSAFLRYEFLMNFWFLTDLINALQGLVIFLLLVVFRKRVRRDLARQKSICCRKLPQDWATIADEDCEELSESAENLTTMPNINNVN